MSIIIGMLVLGFGILIGFFCCLFFKEKHHKQSPSHNSQSSLDGAHTFNKNNEDKSQVILYENDLEDCRKKREEVASNIQKRHKEAAEIMKKSLENIFDKDKEFKTENSDTLDSMLIKIDDLLDKDNK